MDARSIHDQHRDDCRFCSLGSYEQVIIGSTAGIVVPSVGAFVPGWVLAVPAQHVHSSAELVPSAAIAFAKLIDDARVLVERTYGRSVMFEHGAAGAGRTAGCGVNHAHVHVLPGRFDLRRVIHELGDEFEAIRWYPCPRPSQQEASSDFIWVADSTGAWVTRADRLPGQVVRRGLARCLGIDTWDWKADNRNENVTATLEALTRDSLFGTARAG